MAGPLRILALSGSLRAASTNTALLEAAQLLAPPGMTIELFDGTGILPHFTPDLDRPEQSLPPKVAAFRSRIEESDGLLIASPEYAHGIPGSFKNALDWLVSGPEFPGKPIAIAHATARGTQARAALREVLATMNGAIVADAIFTIPLMAGGHDARAVTANSAWAALIRSGLEHFAAAIRRGDQAETGRPIPL